MLQSEKLGALTLSVSDEVSAIEDYVQGKPKDQMEIKLLAAVAGRLKQHVEQFGEKSIYTGGKTVVNGDKRQQIYETQILPMFDKLRKLSVQYSMPAAAAVQIDYGKIGELASFGEEVSAEAPDIAMQLIAFALSSRGDIEDLVNKIVHVASVIGHNSDVLRRAGVPDTPDEEVVKALSGD